MAQYKSHNDREPIFFPDLNIDSYNPISRRQLHDELLSRLRDSIIAGELASGEKIPEKELCDRFGISRTPLREALKVLAYEGLIVLKHNRGAVVKPLTLQDISEVFPVYGRLEALAGELACQKLSKQEIDELRRMHEKMVAFHKQGDLKGFTSVNETIHARIQAASQNRNLVQLMRRVSGRVRRARLSVEIPESRLTRALTEHEEIMAALEQRDSSLLSRAIRDHIENTFRFFRDIFSVREGSSISQNDKLHFGAAKLA